MPAINLPNLSFDIDGSTNKETLNNILDTLQLYRKELNFLLMNLDGENMPSVIGRIEDGEGNISLINQTIDGIQMVVSNNIGDIANLQIMANNISATVANNSGDIAQLELTAKSIQTTVTNHAGEISSIKQTAQGIQTQVSNQAGQISILTQTAQGIQTQVTDNKNKISTVAQTVNGILSEVTYIDRELGTHSSQIKQLSDSIVSKVSYSDYNGREIMSLIEQTPYHIKLSASKIDLDGVTHVNRYLTLGNDNQRESSIRLGGGPLITGYWSGGFGSYLYISASEVEFVGVRNIDFGGAFAKGLEVDAIQPYFSSNKFYLDLNHNTGAIGVRDKYGNYVGTLRPE